MNKRFINIAEISREITGKSNIIRPRKLSPKFKQVINECIEAVESIVKKYKFTPDQKRQEKNMKFKK